MRIKSLHIDNFGKLSNYSLEFDSKLVSISENNGWGKSTLIAFIINMFYGLPQNRSKSIDENDRIHYAPWQGGKFGGSLIFNYLNKDYEIRRTFSPNNSKDEFILMDLSTKREITSINKRPVIKGDLGSVLFGVEKNSFERTAFIPQGDVSISSDSKSFGKIDTALNERLRNLINNTNETVSYSKAERKIDETIKELINRTGKKGKLAEIEQNIVDIAIKINECNEAKNLSNKENETLENNTKSLELIDKKINNLNKAIDDKKNLSTFLERKSRYQDMTKEIKELKDKLKELQYTFADINPKTIDLIAMKDLLHDLKTQENIVQKLENELITEKSKQENYQTKLQAERLLLKVHSNSKENLLKEKEKLLKENELLKSKLNYSKPVLLLLSIITLSIYYFIFKSKLKKNKELLKINEEKIENLEAEIDLETKEIESIEISYVDSNESSPINDLLVVAKDDLLKIKTNLESLFSRFNLNKIDFNDKYNELDNQIKLYIDKERTLLEKENNLKNFLRDKDEQKLNEEVATNDNLSLLEAEKTDLLEERDNLLKEIERRKKDIEEYEISYYNLSDNETLKVELEEKRTELKDKLNILNLTKDFLKEANDSLSSQYLEPLNRKVEELYKNFSEDKKVEFNADSEILIKELNGERHQLEYFSHGTKELLSICMRFSLVDIIYENALTKPFIVLDDSFVNIDDNKFEVVKELVKELSDKYQVFYFTYSKTRVIKY